MGRLIPLLLAACSAYPPAEPDPKVQPGDPEVSSATLNCDEEAGLWTLTVRSTAWTGGGQTAWTVDGEYVELRQVPRVSWEDDGTGETLKLVLAIAEDWREVTDTSTVFTCGADPSGVLELRDLDGVPFDCRSWGPDPAIFETLEDLPSCELPIERI